MTDELAGKVAIVTGAGRGIGRAIAQTLAGAGAAVALMARSGDQLAETAALIEAAGGRSFAHAADVTDRFAAELFVAETERLLGGVDLLVNNAGSGGPVGPLWENDPDEWRRCLGVNVEGPFLYAHAVLPGMVRRGRGRIINLTSGIALRPYAYLSAYNVAKTAVIRMSETLAAETKQHGISVFAVAPGLVLTEMPQGIGSSPEGKKWLPGFAENAATQAQPPDKAAALCLYLATGAADALSGRYLSVRDDLPELVLRAAEFERDGSRTLRLRE